MEVELNNVKDILEKTKDKEMSEDEVAELKAAQEKMMEKAQSLFSKMYEGMQGAGGAGPDMSGMDMGNMGGASAGSGDANDDIIDGDFKEI